MIQVADNFNYRGKKPNFDRDSFDTLQDMKNYSENSLDDGHISYCKETDKHYKFNSNNQSDPTTGKWVEQHEQVEIIKYAQYLEGLEYTKYRAGKLTVLDNKEAYIPLLVIR